MSSSAQLVLLPWLLGWTPARDRTTFAAGLHAGSCVGIGWALREELRALDRRTLLLVAGASLPAAVVGAVAADAVEQRLGQPPQLAALLAGAGLVMWAVDARAERRAAAAGGAGRPVGRREAAWAGGAQVAALVPGVSRSGATLTALRAAGVSRAEAERFSLLMSLPVTAGAATLTLLRADRSRLRLLATELLPGTLTAGVAGSMAVRRRAARPGTPLRGAALYRLGLATAVVLRLRSRKDGP